MAVRGVVTALLIYPENYDSSTTPLYLFQNHFPGTRTIDGITFTYNSFQTSNITYQKDSVMPNAAITFAATAANVDIVEAAIANRYGIQFLIYRWGGGNVDNPSVYNLLHGFEGVSIGGATDFSTVQLVVGKYNDSLNGDLPWRKIPWTILGPLSFRK